MRLDDRKPEKRTKRNFGRKQKYAGLGFTFVLILLIFGALNLFHEGENSPSRVGKGRET